MFLPLTKSIVACLDRASARRLLRLHPDVETLKRIQELEEKERRQRLTPEERTELSVLLVAINLLADLQLEARGLLRRPAGPPSPSKKSGA